VRHRPGVLQRRPQRRRRAVDHVAGELRVEHRVRDAVLREQLLGVEVAPGRIVRVRRVHRHPVRRRARRLRQRLAERVVPAVADPDPVEHRDDGRLLVAQDRNAAAGKLVDDLLRGGHERIAQRRADRRRRVDGERGDAEGGGEGESRTDEERDECDDRGDE
jgi:hypothetical protein